MATTPVALRIYNGYRADGTRLSVGYPLAGSSLGAMIAAGVARTIPVHAVAGSTMRIAQRATKGAVGDGRGRTVLVVSEDIELAVALRDHLDRAYVTVCDVRPPEILSVAGECRPWPWMVIGDTAAVSEESARALAQHPLLLLWCATPPPGLPTHTRAFALFSELVAAVQAALSAEVAGIRLAPGGGVTMPDGTHSGNAALEALVASHPHPVGAPARDFRGAVRALASYRVPLRVVRDDDGATSLTAVEGA